MEREGLPQWTDARVHTRRRFRCSSHGDNKRGIPRPYRTMNPGVPCLKRTRLLGAILVLSFGFPLHAQSTPYWEPRD